MTLKLHKFVPPFTLYLNVGNAQNPAQKHFENTNITIFTIDNQLTRDSDFPFLYPSGYFEVNSKMFVLMFSMFVEINLVISLFLHPCDEK